MAVPASGGVTTAWVKRLEVVVTAAQVLGGERLKSG